MTRIEALKKLAEKVTGVRPTGRTIAQLIDAIAENYTGGGGDEFVIKFKSTQVWQQPDEWTCDRTFEEYLQAINDNKPIKVLIQHYYDDANEWYEPTVINQNANGLEWRFDGGIWQENGNWTSLAIESMFFDEDGMLYKAGEAICLPRYSSDDEGKALKIVDGQPAWV